MSLEIEEWVSNSTEYFAIQFIIIAIAYQQHIGLVPAFNYFRSRSYTEKVDTAHSGRHHAVCRVRSMRGRTLPAFTRNRRIVRSPPEWDASFRARQTSSPHRLPLHVSLEKPRKRTTFEKRWCIISCRYRLDFLRKSPDVRCEPVENIERWCRNTTTILIKYYKGGAVVERVVRGNTEITQHQQLWRLWWYFSDFRWC